MRMNLVKENGLERVAIITRSDKEAKAIYEFRRKRIHIDSIQQLQEIDCLSRETLGKMAPYLNFDRK